MKISTLKNLIPSFSWENSWRKIVIVVIVLLLIVGGWHFFTVYKERVKEKNAELKGELRPYIPNIMATSTSCFPNQWND